MKRRTLLATIGTGTLLGGAGCYGITALTDDEEQEENSADGSANNDPAQNGSDRSESDDGTSEGDGSDESETDQENNASDGEENESGEGDPEDNESGDDQDDGENNESESEDDGSSRPSDATETVTVKDHGVDIVDSPEQDVDKEVYCYGSFKNGEHALRKVRVDAVALAKDGTRLDHGWKPFAHLDPGEEFEVRFRLFVNPEEMHEYLVGVTEAQYAEGEQ